MFSLFLPVIFFLPLLNAQEETLPQISDFPPFDPYVDQQVQTDSSGYFGVDSISQAVPFCYFLPPKGWEIVDPCHARPQIKMAFIKKAKKEGFCPSLNLAVEHVEGTLNEYLNDVKAIYDQDRKNHWRKLGKVRTNAGEAQLTEIDTV